MKTAQKKVAKQCQGQGIGRHTKEEIRELGIKDLKAISDYLGDKPFIMGNKPTVVDCTLFGFLAGYFCENPVENAYSQAVQKEFTNFEAFFKRMKEAYWNDWNDCLHKD